MKSNAPTAKRIAPSPRRRRCGFTLVEVLAALLLVALVIPVVMRGISLAGSAASAARHRDEAGGLAQAKLAELIATGQWQNGNLSGDFSPDWPDYRWEASLQRQMTSTLGSSTEATLEQLDLRVSWQNSGRGTDSVVISTLVYPKGSQ